MRKIHVFLMVSLDGYFEGPDHDLSWHNVDDEFNKFAIEQLRQTGTILFGRLTYKVMEAFWPKAAVDPATSKDNLEIAKLLNNVEKIVFSKTLKKVEESENWKNVRLLHNIDPHEIMQLKQQTGKDIWAGGSDLAVSLMKDGLVDELRIIVNPVVIGRGSPLFKGLEGRLTLKLIKTRSFKSGNVLLYYRPERRTRFELVSTLRCLPINLLKGLRPQVTLYKKTPQLSLVH